MKFKFNIFIPSLDAEIRTIESDEHKDKSVYFLVRVGLYESLGEQGEILTLFYDDYPTEEKIKEDVKIDLKETYEQLRQNGVLSGREESYLNCLDKLSEVKNEI